MAVRPCPVGPDRRNCLRGVTQRTLTVMTGSLGTAGSGCATVSRRERRGEMINTALELFSSRAAGAVSNAGDHAAPTAMAQFRPQRTLSGIWTAAAGISVCYRVYVLICWRGPASEHGDGPGVTGPHRRMGRTCQAGQRFREPGPQEARGRGPHRRQKTRRAERRFPGDQAARDRSGPPVGVHRLAPMNANESGTVQLSRLQERRPLPDGRCVMAAV